MLHPLIADLSATRQLLLKSNQTAVAPQSLISRRLSPRLMFSMEALKNVAPVDS